MHLQQFAKRLLAAGLLATPLAWAHHGGASTSQGPGTPIETNAPLTLPKGGTVLFTRSETAAFRKFDSFKPNNVDTFQFFQLGVSHGLTDYLTGTVILPYNLKSQDGLGTISGFGDARFLFTLGANYSAEDGFQLNNEDDTAVNLGESEKTFVGLTAGFTVPTGRSDIDLGAGVDSGQQPGFGTPSATLGVSMTRGLSDHLTIAADTTADFFVANNSGDRFGTEFRANVAGVYELYADKSAFIKRLDGVLELNYLHIERDVTGYVPESGTGGDILYLTPGLRTQVDRFNVAAAVKLPVFKALNERGDQQGSEGLENFRLLVTVSTYF